MKFSQLAMLTSALFFILATVWIFFPQQLLTQWGIEPTPGIGTIFIVSAVLGIVEWREGQVSGQILFAVLIELFLGLAFLLSHGAAKKNAIGKYHRVNNE
ncbi:hypothetical protein [Serratia marcescens]|uniref:hypothetical protein n=1 Tax=Serratia marcescens TaxID=615 RepID=UPI0011E7FC0A|nr:hypothetical protein [Serratia marcescens]